MDVLTALSAKDGFFTTAEALAAGFAERDIARAVRRGDWVRIRRGAYVLAAIWKASDPVQRHQIRARAVMRSLGGAVALSHVSGVIAHRIDVYGLKLDQVHVTRLDGGAGRIEGDVVHHEGLCVDADLVEVDGMLVLRAERCVIETASRATDEKALCLFDAGLRASAFDHDQLQGAFSLMRHWPFAHHLVVPVAMADGRSGSIGESRGRWFFHAAGLPVPELQYDVRRPDGSVAGTTDWAWPALERLGEFDGAVKYGRLLRPGQQPGEVVFSEKRREDELRELSGMRMIRVVSDDYSQPAILRARFERFFRRAS